MAMEQTPYSKADKTITYLNKQYARLFRRVLPTDELNVIQISHDIYDEAYTLAEQEAARLAKAVYGTYRRNVSEEEKYQLLSGQISSNTIFNEFGGQMTPDLLIEIEANASPMWNSIKKKMRRINFRW